MNMTSFQNLRTHEWDLDTWDLGLTVTLPLEGWMTKIFSRWRAWPQVWRCFKPFFTVLTHFLEKQLLISVQQPHTTQGSCWNTTPDITSLQVSNWKEEGMFPGKPEDSILSWLPRHIPLLIRYHKVARGHKSLELSLLEQESSVCRQGRWWEGAWKEVPSLLIMERDLVTARRA